MSPSPSAFASVPSTTSSQADPCVFRSALNQLKVDDKAREAKKSTEFSTFLSLRASHLVADDSQRGCIPSLLKREEITRRPNSSRLGSPRWLRRSSKAPRSRRSYPSHPLPILPSHPSLASIPSSVLYLGVTSTYVAFLSSAQSKRELPTALLHPPRVSITPVSSHSLPSPSRLRPSPPPSSPSHTHAHPPSPSPSLSRAPPPSA